MYMGFVQIISIVMAVLFFVQVVWLTSKNKLQDQQAFLWLVLSVAAILIACLLPVLNRLARAVGISYMPSFIFVAAFFVVLTLLMYHTIVLSKQQAKLTKVIQELAYVEKELEDLKHSLRAEKEERHDAD